MRGIKLTIKRRKTRITCLSEKVINFLGYEIYKMNPKNAKIIYVKKKNAKSIKQRVNPRLILNAPIRKIKKKLVELEIMKKNNGTAVLRWYTHEDHMIIRKLAMMWHGIRNYYHMATNKRQLNKIWWVLAKSCILSLVFKHKLRSMKKGCTRFGFPPSNQGELFQLTK